MEQVATSLGEIGSKFILQSHLLPTSSLGTPLESKVFAATPIYVIERQRRSQLHRHNRPSITEEEL
ncbi:restriction endonuclease [Sesbania bispinosa]|nr:restriction endonuclease [Sesbania bispinosa]